MTSESRVPSRAPEHPGTLLGGPTAPRVVLTAVVLLLFVPFAPTGTVLWRVAHVVGALAFCGWIWLPERHRRRAGLVLGLVTLGGAALDPAPGIDILAIAGTTALLRSARRPWALAAAAAVGTTVVARPWVEVDDIAALAVSGLQSMLVVFVIVLLDRTSSATRELVATTHTLAAEHVDRDRARIGDRLRSLIGRTLLTARADIRDAAAVADPGDADVTEQLRALDALVDDGLAQLTRLTLEPVAESLETEIEAAREVCERLGIAITVSVDEVDDPVVADTAALVLREAVTNMLKHAEATRCVVVVRVTAHESVLAVTNDGVSPVSAAGPGPGTGQERWRRSLEAVGAELTTTALDDGRYQVVVRFPQSPPGASG